MSYAPRVSTGFPNLQIDGSEDNILYERSDASSENSHEDYFRGSDDDFLGFYDE